MVSSSLGARQINANRSLVRSGQSSLGGDAAFEFQTEYAKRVVPRVTKKEQQLDALGFLDYSDVEDFVKKMQHRRYPEVSWKASNQLSNDAANLYYGDLLKPKPDEPEPKK